VDRDRHAQPLCFRPERIVVARQVHAARGPRHDRAALHAHLVRATQLRDRALDPDVGDQREADQPLRRDRAEFLVQPVVVGLHAGLRDLVVARRHEVHRRAHGCVDHLGTDAVLVLLREARLTVERALVHLVDPHAGPLVVGIGVLAAAAHGDEPDRRGRQLAVLPRVAALVVLDKLRRKLAQLGRKPLLPEVGRLDDVGIR
jgi:hypothetical protein